MKSRRLQIEEALDVVIHNKRALDFQWLATQLAKDKWPDLEATEWYRDGGEDAASHFCGPDGLKLSLACSITGTLSKVRDDARRIRERGQKIDFLIFATPVAITQVEIDDWRAKIKKEFGHDLHVVPRSEITTLLEQPPAPELPNAAPYITRYLEFIHRVEPDWAMAWLASQLMQGQLWWNPFTDYLGKMPEALLRKVVATALDADLDVNTFWTRANSLGRSGSPVAAKVMLDEYLAFKAKGEKRLAGFDREDALKNGLHEFPLSILVNLVIDEADRIDEFQRLHNLIRLIMPNAPLDSVLRFQLTQEHKNSLRSLAFRLNEIKPKQFTDPWFRAYLAVLIGAVGKPEDAKLLEAWLQDERERRKRERLEWQTNFQEWQAGGHKGKHPGPRNIMVYWNWYPPLFATVSHRRLEALAGQGGSHRYGFGFTSPPPVSWR